MYTLLLEYYLLIKLINLYLHDKLTVSFVNSKDPVIGFKDVSSVLSCYSNCFTKLKDRLIKTFLLAAKKTNLNKRDKSAQKNTTDISRTSEKAFTVALPINCMEFLFPQIIRIQWITGGWLLLLLS